MSGMFAHDFTADGNHEADIKGASLVLMVSGTFGGGTLAVQMYSNSREAYRTVAAFTEATTSAQEVYLGEGQKFCLQLIGATTPNLEIDYWFV